MSARASRQALLSLCTALTLGLAACGGDSDPAAPAPAPEGAVATLTITNATSANTAMFIRTRACGAVSWGADILGSSILGHGESVSTELEAGCYDVRVTPGESGAGYLYFTSVQLAAGAAETLTITAFPSE